MVSNSDVALMSLLSRVKSLVVDAGLEADDAALLAAFRDPSVGPSLDGSVPEVWKRIEALPSTVAGQVAVPTASRLPGGSLAHRAVNKLTSRNNQVLLDDIRALALEVRDRLLDVATTSPTGVAAIERVSAQVEAVADAVGALESELSVTVSRIDAVENRLAKVEAETRSHDFRPWFSSMEFDDEFRGSRNVILDRYHDLADVLAATGGPIVDLGCGRGELVQLLMTRDVEVWGVEVSPELVEYCRSIYLDVRLVDAATTLTELDDAQLGGAALIHVVEHITAQQLTDLVTLLARKVRPGGVVVAETPNATSPYVYSHSFYLDPTHTTPVHPQYLRFLFEQAGFSDVEIEWRSEVSDSDRLTPLESGEEHAQLVGQVNAALTQLDRLLLGPQDYAIVAVR